MRLLSLVLGASLAAGSLSPAFGADYYGAEPMPEMHADALVPACNDPKVLADVEDQFEHGAVEMLQTGVVIDEFSGLMEKAYFPMTEDRPIERRYCQGEALISDGHKRTVYYVVSHPLGFASIGWKAEGCVLGLDKWLIYGANCQSLRRF
ncbi:hypothetical protein Sa4125_13340 [Aureimonas sp. SA4125]|uniref:hypothetical protein n=1 Tax=Aureimonas sp. SA4125 TaxID=2826993 RepID=UPI001CC6F2D8|nr:hypothetical protein [Aureimonas sp. SA4125]BDA83792.1 hypothetical protein Sa4125_13340 [Aureimonas sp. SA4125]